MEALILLLIAVIAAPILLVIVRHSRDEADKMQKEKEPGIKITVNHPKVPRLICPRCGSPVMLRGNGWECGWCLDSGGLDSLPHTTKSRVLHARFICSVDLPETWTELKAELYKLVPKHADALLTSLGRVAVHQLSISSPPQDDRVEPQHIRDLYAFLETEKDLGVSAAIAARIEHGEKLFAAEGALSEANFGSFWQALLDALEDEGIIPWEADTEAFFRALACFQSWRDGGPGNDHAFLDNYYALLNAFHDQWEARHLDDTEDTSLERSEADQNAEKS